MRCDLHVHSWYSGRAEVPVLAHVGRECYSDPTGVYERAIARAWAVQFGVLARQWGWSNDPTAPAFGALGEAA